MKEDAPVQAQDGSEAVRQATSRLNELASGFRASQALYVAAEFGIADHLADRSLTSAELAKLCGTNCNALNRLMRALCAFGVFSESRSGGFSLTSVGRLLRSDIAESYRAGVLFMSGPVRWRCWSRLEDTTRTGVSQSDRLLGMPLFDFYASNPAESKIHDEAMRAFSASHAAALVKAIDINHAHLVVDIGGGTGELLAKILSAHPGLHGVLFDLPNVVGRAEYILADHGVADRCVVEPGSFFGNVPGRGDIYVLKQILHDWDDERALDILLTCRRCIPRNSRVLILERIMPQLADESAPAEIFLVDLEMLVMTPGGRERTEAQYRKLLGDAGFECLSIAPTPVPLCIIEAKPA